MFEVINRLLFLLFRRPYIYYRVVESPRKNQVGYVRTSADKKIQNNSVPDSKMLLMDQAVLANLNFINNKCSHYLKGRCRGKILDVGCASGDYSKIFRSFMPLFRKMQYYGLDSDSNSIKSARLKYPHRTFFDTDIMQLHNIKGEFDVVFCSGSLQYTVCNWKRALKEIFSKTGKHIVITRLPLCNFSLTPIVLRQRMVSSEGREERYLIVLDKAMFESFLKSLGLKVLVREVIQAPYRAPHLVGKITEYNYLIGLS
jgi:SAM-dependent methyltransferase